MSDDANKLIRLSVRMVNKNMPAVGSDLVCRDDASLEDLDSFVRTHWLDQEHLSVFVPFSRWDYRYDDEDIVPLSTPVRDALGRHGEVGYMHDFGAPTEICFDRSTQLVPSGWEMKEGSKVASLSLVAGAGAASRPASAVRDVSGPMDEAFPELSRNLMEACLEIGKPIKGNNPYIKRESPFYCTIFDCGGELNSGPVHTGVCRGMDVELRGVERITRDHYSGRLYGYGNSDTDDDEEDAEIAKDFSFARTFPLVEKWMMTTGKNNLIIGKCGRPGPFFRAFKGKNIVFSTELIHLHPCFTAFEEFLEPPVKKSHKRKSRSD